MFEWMIQGRMDARMNKDTRMNEQGGINKNVKMN